MIYILANRPKDDEQREGFLQRVWAIDSLLVDEHCVYDDDFVSEDDKKNAMLEASTIYVHSIYNAEKIISLYAPLGYKIVTDLHGVVPEEERFSGNEAVAEKMEAIEAEVMRHGAYFVTVTSAMTDHFMHKYNMKKTNQWIVLPIFNDKLRSNIQRKTYEKNEIIYSGGAQKWQNCELMIRSFAKIRGKVHLTVLSNDSKSLKKIVSKYRHAQDNITLKSVANSEIAAYYDKSSMGFVLRDRNTINRVACPTKVVEYMKRGVIPIVQFDDIGDFKSLGYQYIKLGDFEKGNYTTSQLSVAAIRNLEVLNQLELISKNGARELITIIANHRASWSMDQTQLTISRKYIENLTKIEQLEAELRTEQYNRKMGEERIADLEQLVYDILHSKRWRLGEMMNYPREILKKAGKSRKNSTS